MVKQRGRGRRRWSDGETWIAQAAQTRARGTGRDGPPTEMWHAVVTDLHGAPRGAAAHLRRDRALRAALDDAIGGGRPATIVVAPEVIATGELGGLGVALRPIGDEHGELVRRFEDDARAWRAMEAELPADDETRELEVFAGFLEAASAALIALEGDEERCFTAFVREARRPSEVVLLWAGATPAVLSGAATDEAALCEASGRRAPAVASRGLLYLRPDQVARGMVPAMRKAGWRHGLMPCTRFTDDAGALVHGSTEDLRALTVTLEQLVAGGLASAARGTLGPVHGLEVRPRRGVTIRWYVESGAAEERAPRVVH